MKRTLKLSVYKLFFGILGISAVVTEIAALVERGVFKPENFFSFFTIESNIFAAIMFIVSALAISAGVKSKPLDLLRGAATLYMVVTGIVFAVLLSGIEGITLTAVPWDNMVLHYIIPVAVIADWFIDRPHHKLTFRDGIVWLIFPVAYVAYSLIRGSIVGWYPYPFLNPATNGLEGVIITSIGIAGLGVLLTFILTRVRR